MPSILLSDNGVSSGSAGLKSTAASDGALALQTTTLGGTATTAVTIDTSQNVGIGNASPARQLSVYGSFPCLQLTNATAGATANDGLLIFQNGLNAAISNQEAGYVAFETANTERMRINAGAPILCLSGGNTSATGTGIAFPASQSASSDANTLDDYEEGTWTPALAGGVSDPTGVTYLVQEGTYVKIGKQVWISGRVAFSTYTGGSGNILIKGVPFRAVNNARQCWGAMMTEQVTFAAGKTYIQCVIGPNEITITPIAGGSAVNYDGIALSGAASSATYKFLTFGITYVADA